MFDCFNFEDSLFIFVLVFQDTPAPAPEKKRKRFKFSKRTKPEVKSEDEEGADYDPVSGWLLHGVLPCFQFSKLLFSLAKLWLNFQFEHTEGTRDPDVNLIEITPTEVKSEPEDAGEQQGASDFDQSLVSGDSSFVLEHNDSGILSQIPMRLFGILGATIPQVSVGEGVIRLDPRQRIHRAIADSASCDPVSSFIQFKFQFLFSLGSLDH